MNLQFVLGVDKDNPLFSIYSPEDNPGMLEVYFGLVLLERVERWKDSLQFKLFVACLYNMNYKRGDTASDIQTGEGAHCSACMRATHRQAILFGLASY